MVLGTGGTISMAADERGDLVPALGTAGLLRSAGVEETVAVGRDILHLDSSNLTLENIDSILAEVHRAATEGATGVVVLHGTDTLEETATAASLLLASEGCPVVFTGAQRPSDDPHPDGPPNLRLAIDAAVSPPDSAAGVRVMVAFGGQVMPAFGVSKIHTTADVAFAPVPGDIPPELTSEAQFPISPVTPPAPLAGLRVGIVYSYAGADASLLPQVDAVDGLVIAGMGSGNISSQISEALQPFLDEGIPVLLCTRVPVGGVHLVYGGAGGGAQLGRRGIESAGELRPQAARVLLLARLALARQE